MIITNKFTYLTIKTHFQIIISIIDDQLLFKIISFKLDNNMLIHSYIKMDEADIWYRSLCYTFVR